ncbi:hypothetical protein RSOLAG1IB_11815 [Rhizoctonia solani AG-1 IB]|uniref:Uncharacterized protein n=1 Tax=Thanatephorus cucumeris (strain AG1-IB / isolate 7/3/14) TaxID=1108050 RepID=A0A0B7FFM9_THACB|nr:hypothetical protein RSOLAG1IB_11815 [Rhizoctonia solani AG-1 IB]
MPVTCGLAFDRTATTDVALATVRRHFPLPPLSVPTPHPIPTPLMYVYVDHSTSDTHNRALPTYRDVRTHPNAGRRTNATNNP